MDFIQLDGAAICRVPADNEISMEEIEKIVSGTSNTWQSGRGRAEKRNNTIMGKRAELAMETFLEEHCPKLKYLPYDRFRKDDFKKHAPFDGLLYSACTDVQSVAEWIERINEEIARGSEVGKISPELRREMEIHGIFTVEVKSSNLKGADFNDISQQIPRTNRDRQQIIKNIERWDFFTYPNFLRKTDTIKTFYEYAEYVRENVLDYQGLGNRVALSKLMRTEYENASDIHTRFYFDNAANELYIPVYLWKHDFFYRPKVGKMPGEKSGEALYYMHGISSRKSFWEVEQEFQAWPSQFPGGWKGLFACATVVCPSCGGELQICNNKQNKKYYYRCYACGHTQSI